MKAWLCPACTPKAEFEELAVGFLTRVTCFNCSRFTSGSEAVCVTVKSYDHFVKYRLIPRHGCRRCTNNDILANAEDWHLPCCSDCWFKLGEPEVEPCPTCKGPYIKGESSYCSNGFHCCRDCTWVDGRLVDECTDCETVRQLEHDS